MSISYLPKEIRLQIWALAYFAETPRLVALRTKPHHEDHDENWVCPRYSPSPAPTIVNVCREARVEAYYQARKAGHLVRHYLGLTSVPHRTLADYTEEFFFRFDTDVIYLPLEDKHVKHFDDSPEIGLLPHFRRAIDVDTSKLQTIAITKVIWSGYHDGSLSNSLQQFPHISRIIMMVPDDIREDDARKSLFVRAARRIVTLYRFDLRNQSGPETIRRMNGFPVDVDFARLKKGRLEMIPKQTWEYWSDLGCEWVAMDGPAQFYESMSW